MQVLIAFAAGLVFAIGLAFSGMTLPSKVIGFLDLFGGHWDPSLAFVMGGAVCVYAIGYRAVRTRETPVFDSQFHLGGKTRIDAQLVGGAALFGVGWGLGGFCPGPALVATVSLGTSAVVFTGAMLMGMWCYQRLGTLRGDGMSSGRSALVKSPSLSRGPS